MLSTLIRSSWLLRPLLGLRFDNQLLSLIKNVCFSATDKLVITELKRGVLCFSEFDKAPSGYTNFRGKVFTDAVICAFQFTARRKECFFILEVGKFYYYRSPFPLTISSESMGTFYVTTSNSHAQAFVTEISNQFFTNTPRLVSHITEPVKDQVAPSGCAFHVANPVRQPSYLSSAVSGNTFNDFKLRLNI